MPPRPSRRAAAAPADEPARPAADAGRGASSSRPGPAPLIVCGRFEGVDERVIEGRGLEEVSIGDYVLSGGEIAAMVLVDACVRLLPGVMGEARPPEHDESFEDGLLEYPHYTRPQTFEDMPIPPVLLSGDHAKIAAWRREMAEELTKTPAPGPAGAA